MNQVKNNPTISKFGIFAVLITSFVWNFEISSIGPALGIIAAAFPGTSDLELQIFLLLPMMVAIFSSIIAGKMAKYFDKKIMMMIGLLIYGVTGILPAVASSIAQMMILRAITGIGVGFVLPMTTAVITDHSQGALRARLIGLTTTVSNMANVLIGIVVGFLMIYTWKAPFYTFGVVLVIFAIVVVGVPKSPPQKQDNSDNMGTVKPRLPRFAYMYTGLMILAWVFVGFTALNMALFVMSEKLFAPDLIGITTSGPGIGCMIGGALFPLVFRSLKKNLLWVSIIPFAIGYFVLFMSHTFAFVMLGNILVGLGQGCIVAYIFCATAHKARSQAEKDMSMGLVSGAIGISAIIQPFAGALIVSLNPGFTTPYRFLFLITAAGLVLWALLALIMRKDLGNPGMSETNIN